jgi:hypothetical protein
VFPGFRGAGMEMPLVYVWGVETTDTGNVWHPKDRGQCVLDEDFDLSDSDVQSWMLKFCEDMLQFPYTKRSQMQICSLTAFKRIMMMQCPRGRGSSKNITTASDFDLQQFKRNVGNLGIGMQSVEQVLDQVFQLLSRGNRCCGFQRFPFPPSDFRECFNLFQSYTSAIVTFIGKGGCHD